MPADVVSAIEQTRTIGHGDGDCDGCNVSELQRTQRRDTVYVLDEPTTGLHPADVDKLMTQIEGLVDAGNTVIVVEHDMRVAAASDWIIDMGPGAGDEGGRVVATGTPAKVATSRNSRAAKSLARET